MSGPKRRTEENAIHVNKSCKSFEAGYQIFCPDFLNKRKEYLWITLRCQAIAYSGVIPAYIKWLDLDNII